MIHEIKCYHCGNIHRFTSESLASSEAKHWKKRHDKMIEILEEMHDELIKLRNDRTKEAPHAQTKSTKGTK